MIRYVLLMIFVAAPAMADIVVAARTIPPQTVITANDLRVKPGDMDGVAATPDQLLGQESRVAIYAGRPIRLGDVGPPALVERNQLVAVFFEKAGLNISTDGRALDRAGLGEMVRVMNLSSRTTVTGRVLADGSIKVSR